MKKYTICILSLLIAVLFSSCAGVSTTKVPGKYLTITNNPDGSFAPLSGSREKIEDLEDLLRTYLPDQEILLIRATVQNSREEGWNREITGALRKQIQDYKKKSGGVSPDLTDLYTITKLEADEVVFGNRLQNGEQFELVQATHHWKWGGRLQNGKSVLLLVCPNQYARFPAHTFQLLDNYAGVFYLDTRNDVVYPAYDKEDFTRYIGMDRQTFIDEVTATIDRSKPQ